MGSKQVAEPVWEIATLFPDQGQWSEEEYLALDTNRLVEFDNGYIEVLPVPTDKHQAIITYLIIALTLWKEPRGGIVRPAGLRVRLWDHKFREPDVIFMRSEHDERRAQRYWRGADLVIEIVSGSTEDRERDLVTKRQEYAQAAILEYWIIDPDTETITVLNLESTVYAEHGIFTRGETATSALLAEFAVSVDEVLDAD
jgi:Uma2 family endonuclease